MTRLAFTFTVVLLGATPALAQEPGRELEFGGGWFQFNPLGIDDISVLPSGPSVNLAWTTWRNERTGITVGVTPILGRVDPGEGNYVVERAFPTYGHVTWRWRWFLEDGQSFFHFGLGIGRRSAGKPIWCASGIPKFRRGTPTTRRRPGSRSRSSGSAS